MFLCRNGELSRLHSLYKSGHFECAAIYGRRRVGKTALINEFVRDKNNVIYFPALNSNARDNLIALSRSIQNYLLPSIVSVPVYPSFDAAFDAVTEAARRNHLIVVIDELQYLAKAGGSIMDALCRHAGSDWSGTDMLLILCGSPAGFMEKELVGTRGMLSDCITERIRLGPLNYLDTAGFNPGLSPADNALVYALTGGIPHYINKLGVKTDLRDAIINNVLDSSSYLFEEPENLLKTELREPAVYNSIITAIANGCSRLGDIAGATGMESSACSKYITTLTELGIVHKVEPVIGKSRRKTQYRIGDNLFRFWYRFVPENMINITSGRPDSVYDRSVDSSLDQYMRLPFEEICRQYLTNHSKELPADIKEVGEWWGQLSEEPNTGRHRNAEAHLDIVAVSGQSVSSGRQYIIGSCKYTDEPVGTDELDRMRRTVAEFTDANDECYYYIFAKKGFTKDLEERRDAGEVRLVSIDEIYNNIKVQ